MFKNIHYILLGFCLAMSVWQTIRYFEKKSMVGLAKANLQKVLELRDLKNPQIFNLVFSDQRPDSEIQFKIRRKIGDEYKEIKYILALVDGKYIPISLGCQSLDESENYYWIVLDLEDRPIYHALVRYLIPKNEVPYLDKALLEDRFNLQLGEFYLERVKEDFSINDLFAFDFSRSELFFGLHSTKRPDCFKPISPPALHFSYIFEWLLIGVIGFFLIKLIISRLNDRNATRC
ncbi:MAG: hypothetical protein NZO16_05670 [Deltaproteobacteria bacterium]|nr:hypothetical protein [Deltaproteobacteria bacterium]